jgi:carboxylate-amine ligase
LTIAANPRADILPRMPPQPTFTLGIEEEFQVVDPETRQLRSHISEMFAEGEKRLKDEIKREMHEAVIEVGTPICTDVEHARREVTRLRREIINLCRESGLRIAASGTHPISHWSSVPITSNERYDQIVYDLQMVARANLIFGLHVHVAIEDLETRIQVMNAARYFLPHVFALSTNSPFWCGQNTGWKSYRAKVFERFPRTGIPDSFRSNSEFEEYVQFLIQTNSIDNAKKIWWDMRPHPFFPTLEYRICDVPMRVEETICIAALFQAITYKLWTLYRRNMGWRLYRRMLLNENKARAARFGIQGKLIDFSRGEEVPYTDLLEELLAFVDDVVDELGSREAVYYARTIVARGTGADRQLQKYEETKDLHSVVDYIIAETEHGVI